MGYSLLNETQNLNMGIFEPSSVVRLVRLIKIPNTSCQYIMNIPYEQRCQFVDYTHDCVIDKLTVLNTFNWVFCDFSEKWSFIGEIFMIISLLCLFFLTSILADVFICANLAVVSKSLRLPESVAGVTILALGNGAPDLFVAYAGAEMNHPEVLFSGLTGSAVFVTTLVTGFIITVRPFHVEKWSLLRNVFFLLCTYTILFLCFFYRNYTIWHTLGIMAVYIVYLGVSITNVVADKILEKRRKMVLVEDEKKLLKLARDRSLFVPMGDRKGIETIGAGLVLNMERNRVYSRMGYRLTETGLSKGYNWKHLRPLFREFVEEMNVVKKDEWKKSSILIKIRTVLEVPFLIALKMLVPLVNSQLERNDGWCKLLVMINLFLFPNLMLFCFESTEAVIAFGSTDIEFWIMGFIVGIFLAIIVFFITRAYAKPKYHTVMAYIGFIDAIAVTRIVCSQVVVHLQTIGARFNISRSVLASTLLAVGNCLIDFVSNVTIAKQGLQNMGFAACFGGPMFNCSVGVSMISIIVYLRGNPLQAFYGHISPLGSLFLFISLISTLIFIPTLNFEGRRCYGIYLILLYFTFFILCILMEKRIHSFGTQYFRDKKSITYD